MVVASQSDQSPAAESLAESLSTAAAPSDPLYNSQWHLTGAWGINLGDVWTEYTGEGVVVAVHDQGIDPNHPDLDGNIDAAHGIDTRTGSRGGAPQTADDNHGTSVAGIIAAERNGIGGVGIAYDATLIAYYDPLYIDEGASTTVVARQHAAADADVLNNSWGFGNTFRSDPNTAFLDNFGSAAMARVAAATQALAEDGRDGLGTIIVQSAGNSRDGGDDTNLHSFQNNRWTVTVGATNEDGGLSSYSTPGATVLVGAPGSPSNGTIVTTDRVGGAGYAAGDYTTGFNGTSAAAPMVSGVVALMLDANPHLGWRDVQEILAYSARTAPAAAGDQTNGATNWNGGGLTVNHDIGFGLVDAHAAVRLAESWTGPAHTSANETSLSASASPHLAITDGSAAGVTSRLAINGPIDIDRVEVTLDIGHSYIGDLQVVLTSPDGTSSVLLDRPGQGNLSQYGSNQDNVAFTFGSVQHWGETGEGTWTLTVRDLATGDAGVLNSWSLKLYGDAASADQTYVYTDEYGSLSANPARTALHDTGGTDTLNGAALTGDCRLDLSSGSCVVAGQTLTIGSGTVVENAVGGDGNDAIIGNTGANMLSGSRGSDTLTGSAGADIFVFRSVFDSVVGSGHDVITDFSHAGGDRIDLSWLDANPGSSGDQAFSFIGTALFTGTAGQLHYTISGHDSILSGDVDGDGNANFEIAILGATALALADFIL